MRPAAARAPRPLALTATSLDRLTDICLGLPGAERELSDPHAGFRVRGRTFAWYLLDHRGDEGIEGVVCKARPGESEALVERDPGRFYRPAYLHHRGWVGLRLDTPTVDWREVEGLVVESYLLVAPKRLAAALSGDGPGASA